MERSIIALAALLSLTSESFADEQMRRIQEELRKQNLYFGEIDGQKNEETARALRRFQERKGFKSTGEPDRETLNALGVGSENGVDAAKPNSGESWPDVPILRSDAARKLREEDRKYLESLEATRERPVGSKPSAPSAPDGSGPATSKSSPVAREKRQPQSQSQPEATNPPARSAPAPERQHEESASGEISQKAADQLIRSYLEACESNRLSEETAYYAQRVKYFDHGLVDLKFIERDVNAFYRRWPQREYRLLDVKVLHSNEDESLIRFRIAFSYRSPEHAVSGKTDNFFTVQQTRDGMKFTSMQEQRIR